MHHNKCRRRSPDSGAECGYRETDETTSVKTDVIHVWSNDAHNRDEYTDVINKFNENTGKEKGIKIEYKVYGGDYYNSLDIAISANEEPHLFKSMKTDNMLKPKGSCHQ